MSNGRAQTRPRFVKSPAVVSALVLVSSLFLAASPGDANPTPLDSGRRHVSIADVEAKIATLNRQAEVASEALNASRVQLADARTRLVSLKADVHRQQDTVDALRTRLVSATLADYQNASGLSTATEFLVADDPDTFLVNLANDAVAQSQQAGMLAELSQESKLLAAQQEQAQVEVDTVHEARARLLDHKSELADKATLAKNVLDRLRAAQRARVVARQQAREALAQQQAQQQALSQPQVAVQQDTQPASQSSGGTSRGQTRVPTQSAPTSDRAQVAVDTALAQIGDPYVYGAAGPDAFDCSGLTMYAWAAAGVSLPHASSMQPSSGTPVAISDLMPGDLVFYYSPISHVGMYIGNGQIVHAPHTGSYVQIVPLNSMPIAMAVRVG